MTGDFGSNLRHPGITLRHIRRCKNATQLALAQRIGPPFTQALISQYERGLQPSPEHIRKLAEALDVTVDVLLRPPRHVRREDPLQAVVVEDTAVADVNTATSQEGEVQ